MAQSSLFTGKDVLIVDSYYSKLNGTQAKVLDQDLNDSNEVVLRLDLPHPEATHVNLWVNISEVELV